MPLTTTIEISADQTDARALRVKLRITNPMDRKILIHNPDMGVPSPAMNWPFSKEVYQISLLVSFGYLSMSVTDEVGQELPLQAILTSATPALRPQLELGPGDSLNVMIPIGHFYQLMSRRAYWVKLTYGEKNLKVSARALVIVP